jgi:hypothetical protein
LYSVIIFELIGGTQIIFFSWYEIEIPEEALMPLLFIVSTLLVAKMLGRSIAARGFDLVDIREEDKVVVKTLSLK